MYDRSLVVKVGGGNVVAGPRQEPMRVPRPKTPSASESSASAAEVAAILAFRDRVALVAACLGWDYRIPDMGGLTVRQFDAGVSRLEGTDDYPLVAEVIDRLDREVEAGRTNRR